MNTRTLILAILQAQEASGYEIKKLSTDGRFAYFADISFGSIYPTLAKLEADGLVTCREESQAGKPDRKIYAITSAGRLELVEGLSQPPRRDKMKSEFLLVAMYAPLAGEPAIRRAIDDRVAWLESEVQMLEEVMQRCDDEGTRWVAGYGKAVMAADVSYLKENRETLIAIAAQHEREAAE